MKLEDQKELTAFKNLVLRANEKGALISVESMENLEPEGNRLIDVDGYERKIEEFHQLELH